MTASPSGHPVPACGAVPPEGRAIDPRAWLSRLWLGLFLAQFGLVWVRLCLGPPVWGEAAWPEALLLLLAAGGVLTAQARQVPGQNVAAASFIILAVSALGLGLGWRAGVPLGPVRLAAEAGAPLRAWLPWAVALWLPALLASRDVARQILRRRRASPNYGLEVIGLALLLFLVFLWACEPLAAGPAGSWAGPGAPAPAGWPSPPGVRLAAQAATALVALLAATPWLIDKRGVEVRPSRSPVMVWALAQLLFLTAALAQHRWALAALASSGAFLVPALALRGAAAPAPIRC
jgi:hypothetical protein